MGFAHRALLMGTQCAERQEAAHSSRQRCHHRGRDKVGGRDRGGEREEGVIILPLCLSVITGEHTDTRGPRH